MKFTSGVWLLGAVLISASGSRRPFTSTMVWIGSEAAEVEIRAAGGEGFEHAILLGRTGGGVRIEQFPLEKSFRFTTPLRAIWSRL
jgi:hypothetical protein